MRGVHSSLGVWLVALGLFGGCSAVINADKDELGGAVLGGNGGATAGNGTAGDGGGDPACSAGCPADQRCNPVQGCVPIACRTDLDCDDGNPCTGLEVCAGGAAAADPQTGCIAGSARNCDDGVACTIDACDPVADCVHTPNNTLCDDGIGCTEDVCNAAALPGSEGCVRTPDDSKCSFCHADGVCSVAEGKCVGDVPTNCSDGDSCTSDTCDDASRKCVNGMRDEDMDGYAPVACGGADCADDNASVHPGAMELCDGEDDNCVAGIDEGCQASPENCDTPQAVTLVDGKGEITGALSDFDSDYSTVCGQSGGLDAVYAIPVSGTSDIVIDSEGSAARVVLAVAEDCVFNGFNFGCAGSITTNGQRSRLMLHGYPASPTGDTLYLLVDGATAGERGAFTVSISVTQAAPDDCNQDVFDLGDCGTLIGYVTNIFGQQRGSCQPGAGQAQPESILRAQGPDDETLSVSVSSNDFVPALYARDRCESGSNDAELGCDVSGNSGGPIGGQGGRADLTLEAKRGDDVFVLIDGAQVGDRYAFKCVP